MRPDIKKDFIIFSEEVLHAMAENKPLVALESNVLTHGLKYPYNLSIVKDVENAVREEQAIPATIGIKNGKILVGMNEDDLHFFASENVIPKVSSRDLGVVLSKKGMGATTVASSILIAELAGIPFFSSAGIGGVHRGAEKSMDISSDLIQFTRSRIAVVCAGAKNILDLPLTLEYLETQCVPLVSYQSDFFPAFYIRDSGLKSPNRMDSEGEIARMIDIHWSLGNTTSVIITMPTKEEDAIDEKLVSLHLEEALKNSETQGISGKSITKYIMRAIDAATDGKTEEANAKVLINTAKTAGKLAYAHHVYKNSMKIIGKY